MKEILKSICKLVLLIPIFSLSGCYYDEFIEDTTSDEAISFTNDIQPIFTSSCNTCHPALVPSLDFTPGNSYNSITNDSYIIANNLDASVLYQRLLGNPSIMPPSGSLPASEINLIKSWIEQGALNN